FLRLVAASPLPACGERSDHRFAMIRVRGRIDGLSLSDRLKSVEMPPPPDPLPARGARERAADAATCPRHSIVATDSHPHLMNGQPPLSIGRNAWSPGTVASS